MTYNCPNCHKLLYNRRLKNCGYCGAPVPENLRFTPDETAAIERKMAELEEGRRQRQLAAEKEYEERNSGDSAGFDASGFF